MARYDTELWDFVNMGRRHLQNVTDQQLHQRLHDIDRNIQFLDDGLTPRDELPPERGWISPWWWLRARHWTMHEFQHRSLSPIPSPEILGMPELAPAFRGVIAGGNRLLVRVSEEKWLIQLLHGRMRFAPAATYNDRNLGLARSDNEMGKTYKRPGQVLRITTESGDPIVPIGDVETLSARRDDRPYWFCSFSSDLDPRLASEFVSSGNAAFLVVFDPMALVRRALPFLNRAAPHAAKELFPNEYYDPYYPPRGRLHPHVDKEFHFAYQREMRMILDPLDGAALTTGEALFVEIGSIADIAGVYGVGGQKVDGAGPDSFLA